jgi:hypothetical protein
MEPDNDHIKNHPKSKATCRYEVSIAIQLYCNRVTEFDPINKEVSMDK